MILFSRKVAPLRITLKDGTKVGEIWRYPRRQGYGLQLDGVYWRHDGTSSTRGGRSAKAFRTLREARIAAIDAALDHLAPRRR